MQNTDYVKTLSEVYKKYESDTKEVAYFIEQVTGHLIPDFRYALKHGVLKMIDGIKDKEGDGFRAMELALQSVIVLADRYREILENQLKDAPQNRANQLEYMIKTLERVPRRGAR